MTIRPIRTRSSYRNDLGQLRGTRGAVVGYVVYAANGELVGQWTRSADARAQTADRFGNTCRDMRHLRAILASR